MPSLKEVMEAKGVQPLSTSTQQTNKKKSLKEAMEARGVKPIKKPTTEQTTQTKQDRTQEIFGKKSKEQQSGFLGLLNKSSEKVDKVLRPISDLFFGKTAETVGSIVGSGYESAKLELNPETRGKITPTGPLTKKAQELVKNPKETAKTVAMVGLEGTTAGFGEKVAAKLGAKLTQPLVKRASKLYQSALKPVSSVLKKSPDIIETGLNEGIRVSRGGLKKTLNIIEDIGEDIGRVIDSGIAEGKAIQKKDLLPYLDEMKDYFKNVASDTDLVKEIDDLAKSTINRLDSTIPVEKAQEIKVATQNYLRKFYNREAPLKFEVQKQVARGLKEEIAKQVPEIAKLNARDRKLIGLEEALEHAVKRIDNRNIIGLGDMIVASGGLASGGGVGAAVSLGIFRKIIENPAFKSQVAIIQNQLAKNMDKAVKAGRVPVALTIKKILDFIDSNGRPTNQNLEK